MGKDMDIGEVKQWEGHNVVDYDGKKIGTLEDVYLAAGSSEAVFACVKTGMLGRRQFLVPLAGTRLSRNRVQVAYQQDQVKGAPQFEPGATLDSGMEQALARHYDIELTASPVGDAPRYKSARALERLEVQAREMTQRADELIELGAALQLARGQLPQADGDHQPGAHKPQDEPRRQQPPSP
jgi:sporulation protein YlmC with PRC-barrel domain